MAGFGAVFLVGMGVVLPVVFGLLLWRNKDRLSEPIFSTKVGRQAGRQAGLAVTCLTNLSCSTPGWCTTPPYMVYHTPPYMEGDAQLSSLCNHHCPTTGAAAVSLKRVPAELPRSVIEAWLDQL